MFVVPRTNVGPFTQMRIHDEHHHQEKMCNKIFSRSFSSDFSFSSFLFNFRLDETTRVGKKKTKKKFINAWCERRGPSHPNNKPHEFSYGKHLHAKVFLYACHRCCQIEPTSETDEQKSFIVNWATFVYLSLITIIKNNWKKWFLKFFSSRFWQFCGKHKTMSTSKL